jgi:hypothetical protein
LVLVFVAETKFNLGALHKAWIVKTGSGTIVFEPNSSYYDQSPQEFAAGVKSEVSRVRGRVASVGPVTFLFSWPRRPHDTWHWWPRINGESWDIPLWLPFALTALPTTIAWRTHIRRRRRDDLCRACRYDLRGLPVGSVCPECGRPTASTLADTPAE